MKTHNAHVIAVANQKGGVGKTTTTVNLAHAWSLINSDSKPLIIDLDPQGNATQACGVDPFDAQGTISELIRNRSYDVTQSIARKASVDIIPATPLLAQVEREMVGQTNSELRLKTKIETLRGQYGVILIDTPPTFGPLLNAALNAADSLIIPVDSGVFALQGIRTLLNEIQEIKTGTNPRLRVLGYLLTLADQTCVAQEIFDSLVSKFGDEVFETRIRRSVKLREAPAFAKSIFQHAPNSGSSEDYLRLVQEVQGRLCESVLNNLHSIHTV